jgi:hypothetical protein
MKKPVTFVLILVSLVFGYSYVQKAGELALENSQLQSELASQYSELNECQLRLDASERELRVQIDASERKLRVQIFESARLQDELNSANFRVEELVGRINNAIWFANSQIRFITDIPSEDSLASIFILRLFDASSFGASSYEKLRGRYNDLRGRYNDLVDRFNAAVTRSNDLVELLTDTLSKLR